MVAMPVVGIFAADAGKIGTVALRSPLERMVVHALGREGIMAVALDLVAQAGGSSANGRDSSPRARRCCGRRVRAAYRDARLRPSRWYSSDRTAARSRPGRRWRSTMRMPISRTIEFFSKIACLCQSDIVIDPLLLRRRQRDVGRFGGSAAEFDRLARGCRP